MFITVPLPPLLYLNTSPRRPRALDKLIRIRGLRVLADPDLPALLGGDMLDPDLLAVLLLELADEARVPELGRDAQVLAAPQQRVGFAPLAGRGDGFFGKVLAFAAGLGDEPSRGVSLCFPRKIDRWLDGTYRP
jgi:hypothetical protein